MEEERYNNIDEVIAFFSSLERGDLFYYDVEGALGYKRFTSVFISLLNVDSEQEVVHIEEVYNGTRISYFYSCHSPELMKM